MKPNTRRHDPTKLIAVLWLGYPIALSLHVVMTGLLSRTWDRDTDTLVTGLVLLWSLVAWGLWRRKVRAWVVATVLGWVAGFCYLLVLLVDLYILWDQPHLIVFPLYGVEHQLRPLYAFVYLMLIVPVLRALKRATPAEFVRDGRRGFS